jgi:hypothetical protein
MNIDRQKSLMLAKYNYVQTETFRRKLQPLLCDLHNAMISRPQECRLYEAYKMLDELYNEVITEVEDKKAIMVKLAKEEYERECAECGECGA